MAPSPDDRLADVLTRSRTSGWTAPGRTGSTPRVRRQEPAAAFGRPRPGSTAGRRSDPDAGRHATDGGTWEGIWDGARGGSAEAEWEADWPDGDDAAAEALEDEELLALLPGNRPIPRRWIVIAVLVLAAAGILAFILLRGTGADESPASGADQAAAQTEGSAEPTAAGTAAGGSPADGTAGPVQVGAETGEVTCHIAGAVGSPGVVRLPAGSRVVDAIEAAGGLSAQAQPAGVNLARVIEDGEQIIVPTIEEAAAAQTETGGAGTSTSGSESQSGQSGAGPSSGGEGAGAAGRININTASSAELETLSGVGPATAQAIISHREENGPFASVDDLVLVHGIGEATLERLRDQITVR